MGSQTRRPLLVPLLVSAASHDLFHHCEPLRTVPPVTPGAFVHAGRGSLPLWCVSEGKGRIRLGNCFAESTR